MRFSRIALALATAVAAASVTGCGGGEGADADAVVASFYPLAFAADAVAPTGTAVRDLTPAGAEPHDLEPGPGEIAAIRAARVVVYVGGGFQPGVEQAVETRAGPALDALADQELRRAGDGGDAVDPHVWLDPTRLAAVARRLAVALGDPTAADPLVARLEALDRELAAGLATCERRTLVTSHAAFGYLADRYGLEQVPLAGPAPEVEPSPREIEALVEQVRASGATTVFSEPLASSALAATVAREAGVRTAELNPLEGLTGAQVEAGEDYVSLMRENLATLREALGCR